MGIKVTALMHAGVRVSPADDDIVKAKAFYQDLLGLKTDPNRPVIKGIPGFWSNIEDGDRRQQIHVMGAEGASPQARSAKEDPTRAHIALAVESLPDAVAELESKGVEYWVYESLVGKASNQVFFEDPFGNMIELQQAK